MVQKDSLESSLYFEDSMPMRKGKLTKIKTQGMGDANSPKNVMDSPDSIYTPLAAGPPAMKALPEPVIGQEPNSQALPGTAMWGGGRRVWTSPREKEVSISPSFSTMRILLSRSVPNSPPPPPP